MLSNPRVLKLTAAGIAVAFLGVALMLRFQSLTPDIKTKQTGAAGEDPLDKARGILRQSHDLVGCRAALQQANSYLTRQKDTFPFSLDPSPRAELRRQYSLTEAELAEIEHPSFTLLDGIHVEMALLMRDVAAGLVPRREAGKERVKEKEAEALFGWVMRQMRPGKADEQEVVPQLGLRRGVASPIMRALIFIALAEQAGIDACLLSFPAKTGETPRYWACGILGSGGKIYVFDPRVGLPLPGSGEAGIATLDDLTLKDSPTLNALKVVGEASYDITPDIAAAAELHLFVSLSGLAPRMRFFEKDVLSGIGEARVAADSQAIAERFRAALAKIGHAGVVKPAASAVRLQREFFPEQEGGVDTTHRLVLFRRTLAFANRGPLDRALKESLGDKFQGTTEEMLSPPLDRIFDAYVKRFLDFFLSPTQPRELLLRGNLTEAARQAGTAADQFQLDRDDFRTNFSSEAVLNWHRESSRAAAALSQSPDDPDARSAALQTERKHMKTLIRLVEGSASEELLGHVSYLRALIKHEQAERLQLRLGSSPKKADLEEARQIWKNSVELWKDPLLRESRPRLGRDVRPLVARAQQMLAEVLRVQARSDPARKEQAYEAAQAATALWEDLAGRRKDLEALGYRLQMKQK